MCVFDSSWSWPGAKYSYVTGYVSNTHARLALQRNEIQFFVEVVGDTARRSSRRWSKPEW